jgi:spore coat-associated protein N
MTSSTATRRKVLVPLATMLAAGAIAVGSGASFTSVTENPGSSFSTGTLTQSNSRANQVIFEMENLKPGDTVNGTVTITNTGTLPSTFTLTETATNGFTKPENLTLTIADVATDNKIWSGTLGTLPKTTLGTWAAGEAHTFKFSATLALAADNEEQGKSATASYTWDGVQVDDGVQYDAPATQPTTAPSTQP